MSLQENESTPTPTGATNPEHSFQVGTSFRISSRGIAIAACVMILLLLSLAMYGGLNAMVRPLVTLLGIAAACASLLSRGRIKVSSRRTAATPDDIKNLPDDIRAMIPEGAKKVYDLKDLPPSLANNPQVQKLFERAGGRGAWVKIESSGHPSVVRPEEMATQGENAVSGDAGNARPASIEKRVTRISFRVSKNSDTRNQISDIDSNGIGAALTSEKLEPSAFGSGFTAFLSKAITWAACLLIFAALAAAAVAWMYLNAGAPAR